jgi:transposase
MKDRPPSRVILETCAEAFAIADQLLALGHDVRVIPADLVRSLGVGRRGVKNDRADARCLSEASCRIDLPSVHIPSLSSRELKSACTLRDTLLAARTQIINSVRGWMRTQLVRVRTGATDSFPKRVRTCLLNDPRGMPTFIENALHCIDTLTAQIRGIEERLLPVASSNPVCRQLRTAPIGPLTSIAFVATLDSVERFESAHAVESYLGLTPGERFSSTGGHRTGITKAGPSMVRKFLIQSCWSAWRTRPNDPLVLWAKNVATRRGRRIAIVAMARKLAGILYAMWRDGTLYDAFHAQRHKETTMPTAA